jgi:hypothetical protein
VEPDETWASAVDQSMTRGPGLLQYMKAAFNARPFGMMVAPNWVGLAAAGLLGLANPGFWVLGAGLEIGYLLLLSSNERFRRTVAPVDQASSPTDDWTARTARALFGLSDADRRRYQTIAERCRSIIELQTKPLAGGARGSGAEARRRTARRRTAPQPGEPGGYPAATHRPS